MRELALDKELQLIISGDPTKLKNALGQAGSQVDKFAEKIGKIGKTMTIAGGIITGAFAMIVKKTADIGDQFDKMSLRTGVSVEKLSALAHVADISGTSIDTIENSLRFLASGLKDAADGTGLAKDAFEELGISVVDSEGNLRDTVDVMKEAATKLSKMTDETKKVALAGEIFGKRYGSQLLPMLKMGGQGIEDLMKQAEKLNLTITDKAAKAAANFKDEMTKLTGSIAGLGRDIGNILIPHLTELSKRAVEVVKNITAWSKEHPELISGIIKAIAVLGVLAAVGGPILIAVSAFMKMKGAIIAVGTALKLIGSLALTNPIGMAIAATGALYLAWTTNFGGIRDFTIAVVDKVKEALGWLWDKVKWVLEKLGLYEEKTGEVVKATDEFKGSMGEASTAVDNLKEENEELATSFDHVKTGADEATEAIKLYAEDVAENYIELAAKSADSWEDFYKFWKAEAERTAKDVIETIEEVGKKTNNIIQKIEDEAGKITGIILPGGGTITVAGEEIPSYQRGVSYVPKTQLALIHEGEEINKPGQRSYDQRKSYSPTLVIEKIIVEGDGNESKIRRTMERAFEEFTRQFGRSGYELPV